ARRAPHARDHARRYHAGAAARAESDAQTAQASLAPAAASLDPDLRFRALYNLGVLALRQAATDSAGRDGHLGDAERAYREALLLRPRDGAAKWNLELAVRRRGGGSSSQSNQPSGGGGTGGPSGSSGAGGSRGGGGSQSALSEAQAEQVLRSIGQQELKTRRDRT